MPDTGQLTTVTPQAGGTVDGTTDASELMAAEEVARSASELLAAVMMRHGIGEEEAGEVDIVWRPGMTAEEILESLDQAVAEVASVHADFRKGHVYCYSCQSASCEHSSPPDPDYVFAGYESTGRAHWIELYSLLLNLDDPRTELLFRRPPRIVSRFVGRRNLNEQQLVSFGKNSLTYKVWGQVVAGYFSVDRTRSAMTLQLVETRDHRLHLQVIAPTPVLDALTESVEHSRSPLRRIYDALVEAKRQLKSLESKWRNTKSKSARNKAHGQAIGLMRHLSHSIERKGKQQRKRTSHAELRGGQRRPVHKAGDDIASAQPEQFFRDVVKDAYVVAAKAGRVHVFSRDGRHVTSLNLQGDELDRRIRRRRYQPMSAAEITALRDAVQGGGE